MNVVTALRLSSGATSSTQYVDVIHVRPGPRVCFVRTLKTRKIYDIIPSFFIQFRSSVYSVDLCMADRVRRTRPVSIDVIDAHGDDSSIERPSSIDLPVLAEGRPAAGSNIEVVARLTRVQNDIEQSRCSCAPQSVVFQTGC